MKADPTSPSSVRAAPAFIPGRQISQLTVIDRRGLHCQVIHETPEHIEAPNWSPDGKWLVYNSGGRLFRIHADGSGAAQQIAIDADLHANNDHVLAPDGRTLYFSVRGGHLYAVPWEGGAARRISNAHPAESPLRYFLHGISPDGLTLIYVGITGNPGHSTWGIYTIPAAGGSDLSLLVSEVPMDGPEYSPDGRWIYYNGEDSRRSAGHSQIYRMRPDGSKIEQLTFDERVNWFPHVSPDGTSVAYLSYPSGTLGHPANLPVTIHVMQPNGQGRSDLASLLGGQGTLNVNSWAPHSDQLAYVAYPQHRTNFGLARSSGRRG